MQQLNLFAELAPVLPVTYYPDFLSQELANELYQHCLKLEWQQNQIRIAGKTMPVPALNVFTVMPDVITSTQSAYF
ncbi:alpha-ketoglutarate-dependent dioxygenase AlkB [Nostoc flagelliforme]|uniref:alpha-ketoglutarate-dependent dioxygenase AlkB n=1 Tax=Nostoc flagelliforme TaxID=1306274 RepID=UPI001CED3CC4|nr:alpha-ketoglutarate-dependent dioxygenase AlkB [Nostoc flagelliforme]